MGMGLVYNVTGVVAMAATPAGREGETSTALGVADALGFALAAGVGGAVLAWSERAGWSTASALSIVCALDRVRFPSVLCWRLFFLLGEFSRSGAAGTSTT